MSEKGNTLSTPFGLFAENWLAKAVVFCFSANRSNPFEYFGVPNMRANNEATLFAFVVEITNLE